jgi:hypothetical protein
MVSAHCKKSIREKFSRGDKFLESWTLYESFYEYIDFRITNNLIVNDYRLKHCEIDYLLRKDY